MLVSAGRTRRPWRGLVESPATETRPSHDPECYLCPGNQRAGGAKNPDYAGTFGFDNDFAALDAQPGCDDHESTTGLLVSRPEPGICRVLCFSPRHDLTLAEMDHAGVLAVIDLWTEEYRNLGNNPAINHVQIFENKGELMGCSNPHPHGQVWAQRSIPDLPARELQKTAEYFERNRRPLLGDYLQHELQAESRLVCHNDEFVALVPFWAVWPFEILVLPRKQVGSLLEFSESQRDDLADIVRQVTVRYDNLFQTSFPYSSGIHQNPTDGAEHHGFTFHMHFFPPLLRSATVRKFMVGYEMLAGPQRDISPESAAQLLRSQHNTHFRQV